jgi:hypothetical protein
MHTLSDDHKAVFCCGRIAPFTPEEKAILLAKIPEWEAQEQSLALQSTVPVLPERFRPAYQAIQRLEGDERYQAAFIVGSVARGGASELCNLEVVVIVDEKRFCRSMSHPSVGGVQLDLAFVSQEWFEEKTKKEIDSKVRMRPLTIAESIIIFDKRGVVRHMQEEAQQLQPDELSQWQVQAAQSLLLRLNATPACYLEDDPLTALVSMHVNLISLLLAHYRLHQRWWVGPHRQLADLATWDVEMARLVGDFVATSEVHAKAQCWSTLIDYVLQPLGGREPLPAWICPCSSCQKDIALLLE